MKKIFTSIVTYLQKRPKLDILILAAGIALFLAITLFNAPRASLWFDEAFGVYLIQFSFWDIARFTASDVHPPFYYWMLKAWSGLFGTTELAYRSLSVVFGAAAIVVSFLLSRKYFGRKIAWLSLVFLVLSPMLIRYSDEARMYTMAAFIVMLATYVMLRATETGKKKYWVTYAILVSVGMWTHYFTALAWLAHWAWRATQVWRKGNSLKEFLVKFFSKTWIVTYAIAVGLFLPWIPFMINQLGVVQSGGFWIGPVSMNTSANFFSNYFYYLESGQVQGWAALALIIVVITLITLIPKAYKALSSEQKKPFLLVTFLAFVPPALLILASLPPLRSSFVERYLVPAFVALSVFLAIVLIMGTRKWKRFWRALPILAVVGMMIVGITNVYTYGNFNKNTNTHILTREAVQLAIENAAPGVPIVANSPWIFYEAAPYATEDHPIYFIDENTDYIFGSLDMLKYTDTNKIKDLAAFEKQHPVIWYLGNTGEGPVAPYDNGWTELRTLGAYDELTNKTNYKVTEYRVSGE